MSPQAKAPKEGLKKMSNIKANNKRIAKNSMYMYIRMLFLTVISFYTTRVNLQALGIEDFGIYQIVGGIIVFFSFFKSVLASVTQRYMNVEMGKGDNPRLSRVFNSSLFLHIAAALFVLVVGETVGLLFLNRYIMIPEGREIVTNWVYQFTVFSLMVSVVSVPYHAAIIAHERLSVFAYISIAEGVMKLLVAFAVKATSYDKLFVFALLIFLLSVVLRIIWQLYCGRHFTECRFNRTLVDGKLLREMLSFSSWTVLGGLRGVGHTQGVSIVINMFFGVTVNAAMGLANQLTTVSNNFVNNFLVSLNPQVTKLYASGDLQALRQLVVRGCKVSIYLISLIVVPLLIETDNLLHIWLKEVPEYTTGMVRLSLVAIAVQPFAPTLLAVKNATGYIRNYHISLAIVGLTHVPLLFVCLYYGASPYYALYIYIIINVALQIIRIVMSCNVMRLPVVQFASSVIIKAYGTVVCASVFPVFLHEVLPSNVYVSLFIVMVSVVMIMLCVLFMGIEQNERKAVFKYVTSIKRRFGQR